MHRHKLAILAVLSLAMLGILLSSYAVSCAFTITHYDTSRRYRAYGLVFNVGLIGFVDYLAVATSPIPPGWHYEFLRKPPGSFREIRLNLWRFYAGSMGRPNIDRGLMFPAWLPALICTIAPILWIRRRRATRHRGFAIDLQGMAAEKAEEVS